MKNIFHILSLWLALISGISQGNQVEFRIRTGTGNGDWNTKETMVKTRVGDTLRFFNDDSVSHSLHTDGIPFKHTKEIKPGRFLDVKILAAYDMEAFGPLHDHEYPDASFWISATDLDVDGAVTVEQLLVDYPLSVHALVVDDLEKVREAATRQNALALQWLSENPTAPQKADVEIIEKGTALVSSAADLDDARKAFIKVSQGSIALIRADSTLQSKWQLFFCPMVAKNQGYWVQPAGEELANPYMGTSMPGCGSKKPW